MIQGLLYIRGDMGFSGETAGVMYDFGARTAFPTAPLRESGEQFDQGSYLVTPRGVWRYHIWDNPRPLYFAEWTAPPNPLEYRLVETVTQVGSGGFDRVFPVADGSVVVFWGTDAVRYFPDPGVVPIVYAFPTAQGFSPVDALNGDLLRTHLGGLLT